MDRLEQTDRERDYTVAWVDLLAGGRRTGRGVVTAGDHAPRAALPAGGQQAALRSTRPPACRFPVASLAAW
jgi:decaprenylphospho-beta-D-ribofuranose 2-oxidase